MLTIKTAEFVLPLVLGAALTGGVGTSASKGLAIRAADAKPVAAAEHKVIVRLVGRRYTVTAASGENGVVYSASDRNGAVVVANASLDELRRDHPQIYQHILPGIAEKRDDSAPGRTTADDSEPAATGDRRLGRGELLLMMRAD